MQLQMRSQMAKIGLDIIRPFLALRNIRPQMELHIERPRLNIHSPRPVLHIDQSQCFADMDKRSPAAFAAYYASRSRSDSLAGIGRIAGEGDQLGWIENDYRLADLAAQDMGAVAEFNVTAVPKQPPRVWADTYPVQYEFRPGSVQGQVRPGRVENRFQWGRVNAYLRQRNYLHIGWTDNRVDKTA